MKSNTLTQAGLATPEGACDLRKAGDAQRERLVRDPCPGVGRRAMATLRHQCGAENRKVRSVPVDDRT